VKVEVKRGSTLLLTGPASVALLEGSAEVLGAPMRTNERVVVRAEGRIPIDVAEDSTFELSIGHSGRCERLEVGTVPQGWREAVGSILRMGGVMVAIVGPTDVGKSTFTTLLANSMLSRDGGVAILDGDIGQADLGPPGAVALAFAGRPSMRLSEIRPDRLAFTGFTSPSVLPSKVIYSLKRLCHLAGRDRPSVVNTDGWVAEGGVEYKVDMIEVLGADIVVGIGGEDAVGPILDSCGRRGIRLEPAEAARERSKEERRAYREYRYRAFLEGASYLTVRYADVEVRDFKGDTLPLDSLVQYTARLVGVIDEEGWLREIGVLRDVDEGAGTITIYTRAKEARKVEVGLVGINEAGKEIGD